MKENHNEAILSTDNSVTRINMHIDALRLKDKPLVEQDAKNKKLTVYENIGLEHGKEYKCVVAYLDKHISKHDQTPKEWIIAINIEGYQSLYYTTPSTFYNDWEIVSESQESEKLKTWLAQHEESL